MINSNDTNTTKYVRTECANEKKYIVTKYNTSSHYEKLPLDVGKM